MWFAIYTFHSAHTNTRSAHVSHVGLMGFNGHYSIVRSWKKSIQYLIWPLDGVSSIEVHHLCLYIQINKTVLSYVLPLSREQHQILGSTHKLSLRSAPPFSFHDPKNIFNTAYCVNNCSPEPGLTKVNNELRPHFDPPF